MGKEQSGSPNGKPRHSPLRLVFVVERRRSVLGDVLVVVGSIVLVGGGLVAGLMSELRQGGLITVAGGVALIALAIVRFRVTHRRWRIMWREDGAVIEDKLGTKTKFAFADVAAISHSVRGDQVGEVCGGVWHVLRLWRRQDPPNQPFIDIDCYVTAEGQAMQAFADAVSNAVTDQLLALVDDGGTAKSACGLAFSAQGIRYGDCSIPLDQIANFGFFDGRFSVWRKGEELPAFRLNPTEPNVVPIINVLHRKLNERGKREHEDWGEGLGPLLFERRSSVVGGWITLVISVALVPVLARAGFVYFPPRSGAEGWIATLTLSLPLIPVLLGLVFAKLGLTMIRGYLRCHEGGVCYREIGKERRLRYADVSAFTYSATRVFTNGTYSHTAVDMALESDHPKELPPIRYRTTVRSADNELDQLRRHVSVGVGRRLLQQLSEEGIFAWTKALDVIPDAMRYRAAESRDGDQWVELPFARYRTCTVGEGIFYLFSKDAEQPVFSCPVSEPNFFPGLYAFHQLVPPGREDDEPATPR